MAAVVNTVSSRAAAVQPPSDLPETNGKKFAEHGIIAIACKADFHFAKPYAS